MNQRLDLTCKGRRWWRKLAKQLFTAANYYTATACGNQRPVLNEVLGSCTQQHACMSSILSSFEIPLSWWVGAGSFFFFVVNIISENGKKKEKGRRWKQSGWCGKLQAKKRKMWVQDAFKCPPLTTVEVRCCVLWRLAFSVSSFCALILIKAETVFISYYYRQTHTHTMHFLSFYEIAL